MIWRAQVGEEIEANWYRSDWGGRRWVRATVTGRSGDGVVAYFETYDDEIGAALANGEISQGGAVEGLAIRPYIIDIDFAEPSPLPFVEIDWDS